MSLSALKNIVAILFLCLVTIGQVKAEVDTVSFEVALADVARLKRTSNTEDLVESLITLSTRYLIDRNSPDNAIKSYLEAIDVLKVNNDSAGMYSVHLDLAMLYTSIGQYHVAINHLDQAADYYRLKNDTLALGIVYNFMGDAYIEGGLVEQGMPYVTSANQKAQPTGLLARINNNTVTTLLRHGHEVQGLQQPSDTLVVDRAPSSAVSVPDFGGLADLNSGYYQLNKHRYALADYYLTKALDRSSDADVVRESYQYLAELHQQLQDYVSAYLYLRKYSAVNDSLLSDRRMKIISRLRVQLENIAQQQEISELKKDKNVQAILNKTQRVSSISLVIGSIIILFGAYFAIRNYQRRLSVNQIIHSQSEEINQRRIIELENNLKIETMQSMINGQEAERERVAQELHDSLGGLLSTVKLHFDAIQSNDHDIEDSPEYRKAYSLLDMACNEVRSIANNMQPDALLSMGLVPAINDLINSAQSEETPTIEFQYYDVTGQLAASTALNIYRIVQELLNNALKHAGANEILVQLIQKDDELMITVEDDGVGYDPSRVKTGMGTGNIESRVNFLKGEISIQTGPGEGTSTLITVPVA